MDLKQLKTFLVLSKLKNYTKTAVELGYAQSSISAQILQLESELNTKLFDRIGKNVFLTASGEQLIPYATEIITLACDMKARLNCDSSAAGQIIMGVSESLCISQLPAVIKTFLHTHPNIDLQLKFADSDQAISLLKENQIDIALTIGNPIDLPSLVSFFNKQEDILILAPPDHPLSQLKKLTVQHFSNQSFILTGIGCNYRAAFEYDLRSQGVSYQIALETGSIQTIKEMALSGLGLCILPSLAVQKELATHQLVALPYENHYAIYKQLYCSRSKWIPSYLSDFIDLIKAEC